jgi:hypothetical protein
MTAQTESTLTVVDDNKEAEKLRKQAILKAVGLDTANPQQRELAIAIAKRYDLDLMLKHLVLIDGKPYVTRDALLWIAHRSGRFDGLTVTKPVIVGDYWECEASAYRTDMSHPFTYPGRYPAKGGNQKFAPEMAIKVAESMALRRAFNISAPTQDERWDVEAPSAHADEHAAAPVADAPIPESAPSNVVEAQFVPLGGVEVHEDEDTAGRSHTDPKVGMSQCESVSPLSGDQCRRESGHDPEAQPGQRPHRTKSESWLE